MARAICRILLASLAVSWGHAELHRIVRNGRYGFIDGAGRIVIPSRLVWAGDFSEGLAPVFVCGKEGYIDQAGRMAIAAQFSLASDLREGRALVAIAGLGFRLIDRSGHPATPLYEAARDLFNGLAAVKIGPRWGYVDEDGKVRIPPRFDDAYSFISSDRAIAVLNGVRVLIDRTGRTIATDSREVDEALRDGVDQPASSADGLVRVEISRSEWGFAARNGDVVWRARWDQAPDHRPLLGWTDQQVRASCRADAVPAAGRSNPER